jgi:hypothetical protein
MCHARALGGVEIDCRTKLQTLTRLGFNVEKTATTKKIARKQFDRDASQQITSVA